MRGTVEEVLKSQILWRITGWRLVGDGWVSLRGPNQKQLLIGLISIELQNKLVLSFINVS